MNITKKELFNVGGKFVAEYTLSNENITVKILNLGGIIRSFCLNKINRNVVLGYNSGVSYLKDNYYLGAVVGRVCGRIENARFTLDGKSFCLDKNDGENSLHGGFFGFNRKIFDADVCDEKLILKIISADGEGGFPGNVDFSVTYSLTESGIKIRYNAVMDKDTPFNVTNHTYFRLGEDILNTQVFIDSDLITPVNESLIPKGFLSVKNTPFDFKKYRKIGEKIDCDDNLIKICGGYDINYVLNGKGLRHVATAKNDAIKLDVFTDRPAMQFYTGNFLNDNENGLFKRAGFCFETQGFPNAVNDENYPSVILKKGELFSSETIYEITLIKE